MGPFYYYADEDSKKRNHNSWYKNDSNFLESINPWFARGGAYNHGIIAGQFFFGRNTGDGYINAAFRLVLTSKI